MLAPLSQELSSRERLQQSVSPWKEWVLQIGVSMILAWLVLGPIWRITFVNGGVTLTDSQLALLVLLTVLPFWVFQWVALRYAPPKGRFERFLMYFTTYLAGIGPVIALVYHFRVTSDRSSILRGMRNLFLGLAIIALFYVLVRLYAMVVIPLFIKGILRP